MYSHLKTRDYTDDDIIYMNPWPPDIDMDGFPDRSRQDFELDTALPDLNEAFDEVYTALADGGQFVFYIHSHAGPVLSS